MIERSERLKVFHTDESSGQDICIMEDGGRFILIHESELEFVLEALAKASMNDYRTESVRESYRWI